MNNKFVKDNLLPNEQILATARWHWMKNWPLPIMFFLISIALFIVGYYEADNFQRLWIDRNNQEIKEYERELKHYEAWPEKYANEIDNLKYYIKITKETRDKLQSRSVWYFWVIGDFFVAFVLCLVLAFISYFITKWLTKHDEFAITNLRVIAKVGVIRRISFELHNEQVESIGIYQGIFGRIFGYGTLIPGGVGASKVRIRFVKDPFELRQHFYDLKEGQQVTQN